MTIIKCSGFKWTKRQNYGIKINILINSRLITEIMEI